MAKRGRSGSNDSGGRGGGGGRGKDGGILKAAEDLVGSFSALLAAVLFSPSNSLSLGKVGKDEEPQSWSSRDRTMDGFLANEDLLLCSA